MAGASGSRAIYIEDRSLNNPSRAGGDASVLVECVDTQGRIVWKLPEAWPFTDTDHLIGTDPPLEGRLL